MSIDYQFITNQLSMDNWLRMKCQLITNGQMNTNGMSINYQCNTNQLPMDNWLPMQYQSTTNGQLIIRLV